MATLPKSMYGFAAVAVKIPGAFFTDMEDNLENYMEIQYTTIANAISVTELFLMLGYNTEPQL